MSALTEGLEVGDLVTIVNRRTGSYRGYYRGENETMVSWWSERNGPKAGVHLEDYKRNILRIDKDVPTDTDVLRSALEDAINYRDSDSYCSDCHDADDGVCEDHERDGVLAEQYRAVLDGLTAPAAAPVPSPVAGVGPVSAFTYGAVNVTTRAVDDDDELAEVWGDRQNSTEVLEDEIGVHYTIATFVDLDTTTFTTRDQVADRLRTMLTGISGCYFEVGVADVAPDADEGDDDDDA